MSQWGSCKARDLLRALNRIGWTLKREAKGSHRILEKEGWPDIVFSFHEGEEIGPRMLVRVAKRTGLKPSPHFSHPFCCDWLRPAPVSFQTGFPLDSMLSYSPAGNPVRALRGRVLAASRDEGV